MISSKQKGGLPLSMHYERCQKVIHSPKLLQSKHQARSAKGDILAVRDYQSRRWVTRRNIHIDRLASAWLIKQFIDKSPRFYFVG